VARKTDGPGIREPQALLETQEAKLESGPIVLHGAFEHPRVALGHVGIYLLAVLPLKGLVPGDAVVAEERRTYGKQDYKKADGN
jgi:hypothetical protein